MKFSSYTIKKLRELKVGLVYYFGSRTQSTEGLTSDFDIGIVFIDLKQIKNLFKIHPLLYNILTNEFPVTFENDIDIVYLQETSLSFQYSVITEGEIIFEFDPIFRVNYEERIIKEYLDFKPIERIFSEAILSR